MPIIRNRITSYTESHGYMLKLFFLYLVFDFDTVLAK